MFAKIIRQLVPERFRPIGYLTHLSRERTDCSVRKGPFEGMRYVQSAQGSAYIPKLLGIYERELYPLVEEIIAIAPDMIVDIGAAEGYYAVGLARRLPETRVVAFEMEEAGRASLAEMASMNGVMERLDLRGKCEAEDLESVLEDIPNPVVICDVEGYEELLLDMEIAPSLKRACILVELHDFVIPGITEKLKQRFSASHRICHLWQEPRSRTEFPWRTLGTALLPVSYLDWAVSEWRPVRMAWFWMTPLEIGSRTVE